MSPGSGWLDYIRRLVTWTPSVSGKLLVVGAVLLLSLGARTLANMFVPGVAPFSVMFPSILVATLVAGWVSGVTVLIIGGAYAWIVVMDHPVLRSAGAPATATDVVNLGIYAITAVLLVLIVQAYRTSARRIAKDEATHLAERERSLEHVRQLRESEARLRIASEAGRLAIWQSHPLHGFIHNAEYNRILGLPPDQRLTADDLRDRYLPGELERIRAVNAAAFANGEREAEVVARFRRDDGATRWILLRGELGLNPLGEVRGAQGVAMDITDRQEAEERLSLVAREVDHRANNLLAILLGMVRLSGGTSVGALKEALVGRISALGRAHQLLSAARWEEADLRRIVEEELLAFGLGQDARISVEGPDLALTPAAAQGLAMALHELSTNAVKYGALQVPDGQVSVHWSRGPTDCLVLVWDEAGGPAVTPPTRRGLGTTILQRALSGPIGGATRLEWRPAGLRCELELPDGSARWRQG
jgi:PAS domain S-box-containing protein